MITSSNSLLRERDAQSSARRFYFTPCPVTSCPAYERTLTSVNIHNHSATSSTSELQDAAPSLPGQCSCVDASPSACTDVATPDCIVLPPGRPPPTRSATRNCLAC